MDRPFPLGWWIRQVRVGGRRIEARTRDYLQGVGALRDEHTDVLVRSPEPRRWRSGPVPQSLALQISLVGLGTWADHAWTGAPADHEFSWRRSGDYFRPAREREFLDEVSRRPDLNALTLADVLRLARDRDGLVLDPMDLLHLHHRYHNPLDARIFGDVSLLDDVRDTERVMALVAARWLNGTRNPDGITDVDPDGSPLPPDRPYRLGYWIDTVSGKWLASARKVDDRTRLYLDSVGAVPLSDDQAELVDGGARVPARPVRAVSGAAAGTVDRTADPADRLWAVDPGNRAFPWQRAGVYFSPEQERGFLSSLWQRSHSGGLTLGDVRQLVAESHGLVLDPADVLYLHHRYHNPFAADVFGDVSLLDDVPAEERAMALAAAVFLDGGNQTADITVADSATADVPPDRPYRLGEWITDVRGGTTPIHDRTRQYLERVGALQPGGERGADARPVVAGSGRGDVGASGWTGTPGAPTGRAAGGVPGPLSGASSRGASGATGSPVALEDVLAELGDWADHLWTAAPTGVRFPAQR
ncbi:hypothetical protein ACWDU5_39925, partial [Streptomyces tendae]